MELTNKQVQMIGDRVRELRAAERCHREVTNSLMRGDRDMRQTWAGLRGLHESNIAQIDKRLGLPGNKVMVVFVTTVNNATEGIDTLDEGLDIDWVVREALDRFNQVERFLSARGAS